MGRVGGVGRSKTQISLGALAKDRTRPSASHFAHHSAAAAWCRRWSTPLTYSARSFAGAVASGTPRPQHVLEGCRCAEVRGGGYDSILFCMTARLCCSRISVSVPGTNWLSFLWFSFWLSSAPGPAVAVAVALSVTNTWTADMHIETLVACL